MNPAVLSLLVVALGVSAFSAPTDEKLHPMDTCLLFCNICQEQLGNELLMCANACMMQSEKIWFGRRCEEYENLIHKVIVDQRKK